MNKMEKVATYQAIITRYTMNKDELEGFKISYDTYEVISETEDKITVDVVTQRMILERFK
jgi:hypothetical protein